MMGENEFLRYCNQNHIRFTDVTSELEIKHQGIGAYKMLFENSKAHKEALQHFITAFSFEYVATFEEPVEYFAEAVLYVERIEENWLLDDDLKATLQRIGSFEDEEGSNPLFVARFYVPNTRFNWYVVEGESREEDYVFFGYVELIQKEFDEFGYFALSELEGLHRERGVRVLRDYDFKPIRASEKVEWIKED